MQHKPFPVHVYSTDGQVYLLVIIQEKGPCKNQVLAKNLARHFFCSYMHKPDGTSDFRFPCMPIWFSLAWPDRFFPFLFVVAEKGSGLVYRRISS